MWLPKLLLTAALVLLAAVRTAPALQAGTAPPVATTLENALTAARIATRAPAATATVFVCDKPLWEGASGVMRLGYPRRVRPDSPFILASSTKTVTAVMVLQLIQRHRLTIDQRLSRFYPRLPNASTITVRELLNQTSGLAEYLDNPRITHIMDTRPSYHWTRARVLAGVGKPQFKPGATFRYTNTNYVVLGGIVEKVAHRPIEGYFQAHIAGPLHMTRSTFTYQPRRSPEFPRPYDLLAGGARVDDSVPGVGIPADYWGPVWTDGGLASTAPDLARFISGLFAGRLIEPGLLRKMTATGRYDYGFGIYAKRFDGHRWLGHDGSYGGYESEDWHDPARNLSITALTDLSEPDSAQYAISDRIWRAVTWAYDRAVPHGTRCRR